MTSLAKKKSVVVTSAESTPSTGTAKQQTASRQRSIPTRVKRNDDSKLDLNRNPRPSSLTNVANHKFSSADDDTSHSSDVDNDNNKDRKTSILKPCLCLSVPVSSVKPLRRTNSPRRVLERDNRSQLASLLASSNDNVNKSIEKGKSATLVDSSKPQFINKQDFESSYGSVSHHASYRSPSKISHSKSLLSNKGYLSKNLNRISTSDETCVVKCADADSLAKSVVPVKEVSISADRLTRQEMYGTGLTEEVCTNSVPMISDSVKKPRTKKNSADLLGSRMMSPSTNFGKKNPRSRTEMPNSEPRTNLRPRSSGPSTVSRHKTHDSASGERSPMRKDSRKQSVSGKSSETLSVESSEAELGFNKRRKSSGSAEHKTEFDTQGVSNIQNTHSSARNQKMPTSSSIKFRRTARNDDAVVNLVGSSKINDLHCPERSLPKIHVSREPSKSESGQVIVMTEMHGHVNPPMSYVTSSTLGNDEMFHVGNQFEEASNLNRRLFHTRPHTTADLGQQLRVSSCDNVREEDSIGSEFHNHLDGEKHSVESEDVVLDGETFQLLIDELKTMKLTVLHLQRVLQQLDTGENSLKNNDSADTNASVKANYSSVGNEIASSPSVQSSAICQENHHLRKRIVELEKLTWEQRKLIEGLKQTSVDLEINILPEYGNATSEADKMEELVFEENCCTTDCVNKPSSDGCSSEIESSVVLSSSTKKYSQSGNGGQRLQNVRSDRHFILLGNDGKKRDCQHVEKCIVEDFFKDGRGSNGNYVDIQLERESVDTLEQISPQGFFSAESENNFVAQRIRSDEEEWTMDCSMFDYDCSVESDHELELGEQPECDYSEQMDSYSIRTPVIELGEMTESLWSDKLIYDLGEVIHDRNYIHDRLNSVETDDCYVTDAGSEVTCNVQRFCKNLGNVADFDSNLSKHRFSFDEHEKSIFGILASEESVESSVKQISEPEEEVPNNLLVENLQRHENPNHNLIYRLSSGFGTSTNQTVQHNNNNVCKDSLSDINSEASTCSTRTPPNKTASNSRSLLRMPKSYGNASCTSVSNSLLDTVKLVQSKSGSSCETTKNLREITVSKLQPSRIHKASKLSASITE